MQSAASRPFREPLLRARGINCHPPVPIPVESTKEPWGCRMAVVGAVDMASNCVLLQDVADGPIRRSDAAAALQAPGASN